MRTVGLFAGIGGLELGFERAGFRSVLMAERDPICRDVLGARFDAHIVDDVASIDRLPRADVLLAGFPCQPYSQVGRTEGLAAGADHIDEIFRLLDSRAIPPKHVVLENVPFIVHLDKGQALMTILRRLERRDYRWAYRIIDTATFGLPQRRRRWFLVASRTVDPAAILLATDRRRLDLKEPAAHGFYWTEGNNGVGWAPDAVPPLKCGSSRGVPAPPAIWDHERETIWTPEIRDAERLQGFRAGWTSMPKSDWQHERARWRLVGNAVSVPVSTWIAERIRDDVRADIVGEKFDARKLPRAAFYDGTRRYQVDVADAPVRRRSEPILDFLAFEPRPLSLNATRGFRTRYERSNLRRDVAFIRALKVHERRMASA